MAIINYTDQLKYAGKGYLDSKMMPVKTFDDLKAISLTQRFEGLTITVLNDGKPQDYWLVGGITNLHWVPKTVNTNFEKLKLVLEDGFLKLFNDEKELGDSVNLNDFFPELPKDELYITSVDYVTKDDKGNTGIFLCFIYNDETKKYLDMSQFLSNTYEAGSGIIINGKVVSLDDAIIGRIDDIENTIKEHKISIEDIQEKLKVISNVFNKVDENSEKIAENLTLINENKTNISILKDRVNALSSASEGSTPDGKTIGITEDEEKALYVKILEKDGNMIKVENHEGNNGLYATIPVFYEDDETN